jgi:hypothetical protein
LDCTIRSWITAPRAFPSLIAFSTLLPEVLYQDARPALLANAVSLAEPSEHFGIEFLARVEAEGMHVVSRRYLFKSGDLSDLVHLRGRNYVAGHGPEPEWPFQLSPEERGLLLSYVVGERAAKLDAMDVIGERAAEILREEHKL